MSRWTKFPPFIRVFCLLTRSDIEYQNMYVYHYYNLSLLHSFTIDLSRTLYELNHNTI